MSEQKKKRTIAFVAIAAVSVAVVAGIFAFPPLQAIVTNPSNNGGASSTSDQNSDSAGSSIGHIGMMRTINNTHCISKPGGPQIC